MTEALIGLGCAVAFLGTVGVLCWSLAYLAQAMDDDPHG